MTGKSCYALAVTFATTLCSSALGQTAESYRVECQPQRKGDVISQETALQLDLKIKVVQFGQLIDSTKQAVDRRHAHAMEVIDVNDHGASRVRVRYSTAQQTVTSEGQTVAQSEEPVTGKTYYVERVGNDLQITDATGQPASAEEEQFIAGNFQFLGRPNPLREFLNGREFTMHERVVVPDHLAVQLLGMSGGVDKPEDLGMTLVEVREIEDHPCGVFEIDFKTSTKNGSPMSMKIGGSLVLDLNSGRAIELGLSGPVALNEVRGPKEGRYNVNTTGTLRMAVRATGERTR